MSRRGRSGPTISLFSFQDIITSVTAIVTVITLLLALDLVQRHRSRSSNSPSSMASELAKRLERSEAELAELRSTLDSTDDLVRAAAASSPAELKNEIARRSAAIIERQRERTKLEQQHKSWQSTQTETLGKQFDLEPLRQDVTNMEQLISQIEHQISDENAEDRVIYSLPRGENKEGWLAVIDSHKISVAPMGRSAKPSIFVDTGLGILGTTAVSHFGNWINQNQLTSAYFLLLVRPDAASTYSELEHWLKNTSISYGFDVVDVDPEILHPERGAAR